MGRTEKESPFPGATRFSDQIFSFEYEPNTTSITNTTGATDDPRTIIIFGWGDGQAKHVAKYITGYRDLFPSVSKIVVVLATTFKAAYQPLHERVNGMMPVIDAAFPDGPVTDNANANANAAKGLRTSNDDGDDKNIKVDLAAAVSPHSRVLLHTMSNAGGINLASALHAYKQRFGTPMPHQLLVLDSTPGGVVFHEQVGRWARAMAIGMSRRFPWPYAVTYALCYAFLWMMKGFEWVLRRHHAGAYSRTAVNAGDIIAVPARRLYLYSQADDIIQAKDVEAHAAQARGLGFGVDLAEFNGSEHVGHMRRHPQQYWKAIADSWVEAGAS